MSGTSARDNHDQSLVGGERHAEWPTRSYSSTASPIVAKKDPSPIRSNSPNRFSLSFTGSLSSAKHSLIPARAKCFIQFGERVGRGDIHAGDRLRRDDQPCDRERRCRHRIQNTLSLNNSALAKNKGASHRNSTKPRHLARIGIARDVMVAPDALDASQHRRVRTPTIPQELDAPRSRSQCRCPGWRRRRRRPTKHTIDSQNSHAGFERCALRSVTSNRPMAEAMTTAANAAVGTCCSRFGADNSSRATASAPTTPVSCVLRAGGFRHRGA